MMPETAAALMGHILPRENATPLEIGLDLALESRVLDIPVPIRDLWRWDTCPAAHLPWLAWSMSVDLWDESWPETKKRAVIREAFQVHARKGTLWAIRKYLGYIDAPLLRAIVPPDKTYFRTSMTAEDRAAWLSKFPQVRIYSFRNRGGPTFAANFSSGGRQSKLFFGSVAGDATFFPYASTAAERYGRRAFLWDQGPHPLATGEETPLKWMKVERTVTSTDVKEDERVLIPGNAVSALFFDDVKGNLDRKSGRRFFVQSTAATRVLTIAADRQATDVVASVQTKTVRPSLAPINATPELVAERGITRLGTRIFFGGRERRLDRATGERTRVKGFLSGYMLATDSIYRLYDRYYLHDPNRLPDRRPPSTHFNYTRLGKPAFTATLTVDLRGKSSPHHFGRFMRGFWKGADRERVDEACRAVDLAKSYRDAVLLRTRLHRVIRSGDRIRAGSGVRSGQNIAVIQ